MIGAVAAAIAGALAGPVELRGGYTVDAPVEAVSVEGVRVGGDQPRLIGWEQVKRVTGEFAGEAEAWAETSDRAWRARLRLARGDAALASGLFESLFNTYRAVEGPTALVVAEGTLRCRLVAGDRPGALEAWLAAARLREAGWGVAGDPPLRPVLDESTLLAPTLAPVWVVPEEAAAALRVLEADASARPEGAADGAVDAMRDAYRRAALACLGGPVPPESEATSARADHPGVALVRRLVEARVGDDDAREANRYALRAVAAEHPGTWREAWARVGVGRSLLAEPGEASRVGGVFELLHLPARFARSQPTLAAAALAEAGAALAGLDDRRAARALRDDLASRPGTGAETAWLDRRLAPASDDTPSEDD